MNFARFNKPSRYTGNEINVIRKDSEIKVALCFPDTYEIGMSHTGLKILYSIINNIPYASAERVYAPWVDFESYLRENNLLLTSLENKIPLKDFDIVGFTLQYELSYTNILNMLDLGGIPVKTEDRGDNYPIVIAGGPCAVNPLPLVPFIDAFVIGDGEEVIGEILEAVSSQRSAVRNKENLLNTLAKLEGVYVPSIHDTSKQKVKRRIVKDLDKSPYPDKPVVPYTRIIHDRAVIEIARGCTRGCRFCQAGMIYRPLRERSLEKVISLAQNSIYTTGYEEISFTSLTTGDYSSLLPLIRNFNKLCSASYTSISLPSLRVGSINSEVLKEIKSVRKTGFTIAPEAGTKRLRNVINKNFTDEEYEETLIKLFAEGWKNLKLYFMIGLPTETITDIDGLIDMAVTASKKGRKITGRKVNINVGISAFVPKSHTPFQWVGQESFASLREKQDYLRKAFKRGGVNFKGQHVENSLMEAVFSRGGRECALLLEEAWKLGCRFDGWSELFDFDKWLLASEKTGMDLYSYASRNLALDEELPWDFIDTGITKNFLISEYNNALQQKTTSDCRDVCYSCGLECKKQKSEVRSQKSESEELKTQNSKLKTFYDTASSRKINVATRMRIRFSKTGEMRCLSHNELMTAILRALRRAQIPVAYTTGFHPHPKISFGPALASGVEGLNEYFDIELTALLDTSDFLRMMNACLPEGLKVHEACLISPEERSLNDLISRYEYEITIEKETYNHINSFMGKQHCLVSREDKNRGDFSRPFSGPSVDIRPMAEKAEITGNTLNLLLVDTDRAKVRLYEILKEMLQRPVEEIQATMIKRVRLFGYNSTGWIEPVYTFATEVTEIQRKMLSTKSDFLNNIKLPKFK
ncbi:MAG: TIGR03960 family B12-binding radical SAM protein [Nitrospirae bacterium]|nr:TIGR03960 family B12-binding radical SAM protein [Nitrospirota bacterium]